MAARVPGRPPQAMAPQQQQKQQQQPSTRLEDYDVGTIINRGSFGIVYRAVRRADGRVFALKQVPLVGMKRVDREEAIDEARMLAQLNHPYITRHYDSFIDRDERLNILMEYAAKGNLSTMIKASGGKGLPESFVWRVALQCLLGLNHIHSRKIIHRDIKALNLFIDSNNNIKIGDLGIARALSAGSDFAHTIVGTPYYLSPELCEDKPYNEKSDVWAMGVVLYECCTGSYPFDAQNEGALIRKIMKGVYPPIQGAVSTGLVQLISQCLTFKPSERPDTAALLRTGNILAKARAMGIDLNPQPSASSYEDAPTYEARQQQPQQPQQYQQMQDDQQQQRHYDDQSQPGFGGMQQQQRQQAMDNPGARDNLQHNNNRPSPTPYAYPQMQQQQQQQQPHPFDPPQDYQLKQQQQQQQQQGYANQAAAGRQDWDAVADQMAKLLPAGQVAQRGQQANRQPADNLHKGQKDNAKGILYGGPQDVPLQAERLRPEEMPAAGRRPASAGPQTPFALHHAGSGFATATQQSSATAWTATYQPPQYGRRRNPDLQITGPSLRAQGPGGPRAYTPAADDATSYVSTSYQTTYR